MVILALLAASCGGSAKHDQSAAHAVLKGSGFRFEAPAAWKATRTGPALEARAGASGSTFVSATAFTLSKPYTPSLFPKAAAELDRVAANLASQSHGTVTERATVTVDGKKARAYRLTVRPKAGEAFDERIGFVLEGKREYQLLCRAPAGSGDPDGACALLYSSFKTV